MSIGKPETHPIGLRDADHFACATSAVPKHRGRLLRKRIGRIGAVLGLTVVLLVAGSESIASTSAFAAPSGSPIKIGLETALTGNLGSLYSTGAGVAKAWNKYINATGGIAGHPVQLIVIDTKDDAATGLADAATLVSDGVSAAIVTDPIAEVGSVPYLVGKGVPVLGIGQNQNLYGKLPNVFASSTSVQQYLPGQVLAAKAAGKTRFGAIVCAEAPTCALALQLFKPLAPKLGVTYVGGALASATAPNYTAQCLQLIQAGANAIWIGAGNTVQDNIANNCIQQGYKGKLLATGVAQIGGTGGLSGISGSSWVIVSVGFPWWVNAAPVQQFRSVMHKYDPSLDYRAGQATSMWSTLQLFAKALSSTTGSVTGQSVITAYGKVKNQSLGGLLPQPESFTANQPAPLVSCFWVSKYEAGQHNPTSVPVLGKSGNGGTKGLASQCYPAKS
jgi:branched-chain amino acid transport system substrate-binding protein